MILHLCVLEKFTAPFYAFVQQHFDDFHTQHVFFINGKAANYEPPKGDNVFVAQTHRASRRYGWLLQQMHGADRIILHGLLDHRVLQLLALSPWSIKKCYWVVWGADLYAYQTAKRTLAWRGRELIRRFVIRRLKHFVTHVKGDYELINRWYGAEGEWHECFVYPSNLYQAPPVQPTPHHGINILVGNSADRSNGHREVLEMLRPYAGHAVNIYCPLSYGEQAYAREISELGEAIFADKFVPLRQFMSSDEYLQVLAAIDVAIFNHRRQQGMGNITSLLGMGKKVYMRSDISSWMTFKSKGLKVYDILEFSLKKIEPAIAERNKLLVAEYFSEQSLIGCLTRIFNVRKC